MDFENLKFFDLSSTTPGAKGNICRRFPTPFWPRITLIPANRNSPYPNFARETHERREKRNRNITNVAADVNAGPAGTDAPSVCSAISVRPTVRKNTRFQIPFPIDNHPNKSVRFVTQAFTGTFPSLETQI